MMKNSIYVAAMLALGADCIRLGDDPQRLTLTCYEWFQLPTDVGE